MNIENLDRLLGEGNYHWVYSLKNNHQMAVKIAKHKHGQLFKEAKVLTALENSHLFPKIQEFGTMALSEADGNDQRRETQFLVMQKLGISLSELMTLRKGKLGVSMIKNIGLQLLSKLSYLHSIGVVHNDLKPGNVLFGRQNNRNKVYIIDFGLAKVPDDSNDNHNRIFRGNVTFSSISALKGQPSQALDDLQSLFYVLLWILGEGKHPWKTFHPSERSQNNDCLNFPHPQTQISNELTSKYLFLQHSVMFTQTQKGKISKKLYQLLRTLRNCQNNTHSTYSFALSTCESILLDV